MHETVGFILATGGIVTFLVVAAAVFAVATVRARRRNARSAGPQYPPVAPRAAVARPRGGSSMTATAAKQARTLVSRAVIWAGLALGTFLTVLAVMHGIRVPRLEVGPRP